MYIYIYIYTCTDQSPKNQWLTRKPGKLLVLSIDCSKGHSNFDGLWRERCSSLVGKKKTSKQNMRSNSNTSWSWWKKSLKPPPASRLLFKNIRGPNGIGLVIAFYRWFFLSTKPTSTPLNGKGSKIRYPKTNAKSGLRGPWDSTWRPYKVTVSMELPFWKLKMFGVHVKFLVCILCMSFKFHRRWLNHLTEKKTKFVTKNGIIKPPCCCFQHGKRLHSREWLTDSSQVYCTCDWMVALSAAGTTPNLPVSFAGWSKKTLIHGCLFQQNTMGLGFRPYLRDLFLEWPKHGSIEETSKLK